MGETTSDRHLLILGGGLTGLVTAFRLERALAETGVAARVTLLEQEHRFGGKFLTIRREGFIVEVGPEGFVAAAPEGYQLCSELGLGGELIEPLGANGGSSIYFAGRLHPITQGITSILPLQPGRLLAEGVLSPWGALRAALEPYLPPRRTGGEESLGQFLRRRFGEEAWTNVLEPLLGGIAGGEGETLSAPAAAPGLVLFEQRFGSVTAGARHERARLVEMGKGDASLAAPRQGMETIIERLVAALAERPNVQLCAGVTVTAIERAPGGFLVRTHGPAGANTLTAEVIVATAPAFQLAPLLRPLDPSLAETLAAMSFRSMATYSYAFRPGEANKILKGTGYVKRADARDVVNSVTWDSVRWPGHAPDGYALLRVFFGDEAVVEGASEDELIEAGLQEIRTVLQVKAEPLFVTGGRWTPALPRYTLGHPERVATAERRVATIPGLILAGTSYRGRGVVDAIRSANAAAAAAARLAHQPGPGVVV
ncbi:MAG: protoporphyrinogen oxidase [Chloroflexi bacterium]|nr:protoporphyrinogen oxidase [Chloroflexota bacterium]